MPLDCKRYKIQRGSELNLLGFIQDRVVSVVGAPCVHLIAAQLLLL